MQFTTLILSILPAIALAAPASLEARNTPATWTLKSPCRSCDGSDCTYKLDILEKGVDAGTCVIETSGSLTSFGPDTACGPNNRFRVSGGWDTTSFPGASPFITIVVKDVTNGKWSFFGVQDVEFSAGHVSDKVSGVAPIGDFNFPPA